MMVNLLCRPRWDTAKCNALLVSNIGSSYDAIPGDWCVDRTAIGHARARDRRPAGRRGAPLAKRGDEKSFEGPHGLKVKVLVQVPQDQEVDLLFLCFFKHKEKGDTVLSTIEKFDERLGGLIASLRNRGEFAGEELETILINPPPGSIKARRLMLIGLGEEDRLSLQTMRRIGTVALREAARLGVKTAAFGAAIRDQGNTKIPTGDVGREVMQGALLAYDTEKRLQKEGLGAGLALEEWILLAGPQYFHEVAPEAARARPPRSRRRTPVPTNRIRSGPEAAAGPGRSFRRGRVRGPEPPPDSMIPSPPVRRRASASLDAAKVDGAPSADGAAFARSRSEPWTS